MFSVGFQLRTELLVVLPLLIRAHRLRSLLEGPVALERGTRIRPTALRTAPLIRVVGIHFNLL